MKPTLAEVRGQVIDALYTYLHKDHPEDSQNGYLQPEQILNLLDIPVSKHFFGTVINVMRDDGVIESFAKFWMFRLSLTGISEAEWRTQEQHDIWVPASDRLVSRGDNAEITGLSSEIEALKSSLQSSNEAGAILGEDREAVVGELEASVVIVSKRRIRLSALWSILLPTLRFISEKFATGAIGDAAKRLIELLMKII